MQPGQGAIVIAHWETLLRHCHKKNPILAQFLCPKSLPCILYKAKIFEGGSRCLLALFWNIIWNKITWCLNILSMNLNSFLCHVQNTSVLQSTAAHIKKQYDNFLKKGEWNLFGPCLFQLMKYQAQEWKHKMYFFSYVWK